jgi:hypothetical protein
VGDLDGDGELDLAAGGSRDRGVTDGLGGLGLLLPHISFWRCVA